MDLTVLSPEAAVLHCLASGEPLPEIAWIKMFANGSIIIIGDLANITEITDPPNKTSILTIEPTDAQETAKYSCRVHNEQYSLTSKKAQVIVLSKFIQMLVASSYDANFLLQFPILNHSSNSIFYSTESITS